MRRPASWTVVLAIVAGCGSAGRVRAPVQDADTDVDLPGEPGLPDLAGEPGLPDAGVEPGSPDGTEPDDLDAAPRDGDVADARSDARDDTGGESPAPDPSVDAAFPEPSDTPVADDGSGGDPPYPDDVAAGSDDGPDAAGEAVDGDDATDLAATDLPPPDVPDVCQRDCNGKNCGSDGCGGNCGTCREASCSGLTWTGPQTCNGGYCTGGTVLACNDLIPCTDDACTPAGCTNTLQAGACLIGGGCVPDGQAAAGVPCLVCRVSASTSTWTTDCNPGDVCFAGQCCTPQCAGKTCGDDACGGTCGACQGKSICRADQCIPNPCPTGYSIVLGGTFTMGSPTNEPGRGADETQHDVTIGGTICLKTTEVTHAEWIALMDTAPWHFTGCGDTCPVDSVSWWDAVAYCNALSAKDGLAKCYTLSGCTGTPGDTADPYTCTGVTFAGLACTGYRLPTEAEWEYAARAGTTTSTYNGTIDRSHVDCEEPDDVLDTIAWFCGNAGRTPHRVATARPNAWGLSDMLGNVWEWVGDWYGDYAGTATDPTGPGTGDSRVRRGGSWGGVYAGEARAAKRDKQVPGLRDTAGGFRPALTP